MEILVAGAEPLLTQITSTELQLSVLREILTQYNLVSQKLDTWITHFSSNPDSLHTKQEIAIAHSDKNHLLKEENLTLKEQVKQLHTQLKQASESNICITAEKETFGTDSLDLSKLQAEIGELLQQNTTLEKHVYQLNTQFQTATDRNQELNSTLQIKERDTQKWHNQSKLMLSAIKEMALIHNNLRTTASMQIQELVAEIEVYKAEFQKFKLPAQTEIDRATEIAKIEAFDYWIDGNSKTEEQITAKTMFERVTSKLTHTFGNLKTQLHNVTLERDELQGRMEQQDENMVTLGEFEPLLHQDKIEDPSNLISATRRNLAPPVSIHQYYRVYKPIILKVSNLPDIRYKTYLSKQEFQMLWEKANPAARDLITFMWVLKDLLIPKGVVEITTANPPFTLPGSVFLP